MTTLDALKKYFCSTLNFQICSRELDVKMLWNTSGIFHLLTNGVFVSPNLYPTAGPFEWKVADSLFFTLSVCIKHKFIG